MVPKTTRDLGGIRLVGTRASYAYHTHALIYLRKKTAIRSSVVAVVKRGKPRVKPIDRQAHSMAPAQLSLSWAPGERLLASAGDAPTCDVDVLPPLPPPYLTLFYQGHLQFIARGRAVLDRSRAYRAAFLECQQALDAGAAEDDNGSTRDAHVVWSFVEAVYLDVSGERHLSARLADWYFANFSTLFNDADAAARPGAADIGIEDDEVWALAARLAAVGARDQALELLLRRLKSDNDIDTDWAEAAGAAALGRKPNSSVSCDAMAVAEAVLQHCPGESIAARTDGRWQAWQTRCREWADSEEMEHHAPVRRLLGLLSGSTPDIAAVCEDWLQMLVASAIYSRDLPGPSSLRSAAENAVAQACSDATNVYAPLESVAGGALTEAALGNVANTIVCMGASLQTTWFAAHLCDLLVQAGRIPATGPPGWAPEEQFVGGMREYYIQEFARGLERYRGMWRIAADYYAECPTHGDQLLVDMLGRIPFEGSGDPTAEKALLLCSKKGLRSTSRDICERLGADCLHKQNFGGAMSWFARGGLTDRAHSAAEEALRNAEEKGSGSRAARALECVVCAISLAGNGALRESLDYMRVYSELQRAIAELRKTDGSEGSLSEDVGSAIVESARRLVGGGGLPRKFWAVVAREVAMCLEDYSPVVTFFSSADLHELLGALQLVSGPCRSPELVAGLRGQLANEKHGHSGTGAMTGTDRAATVEEADQALQDARRTYVSVLAKKIYSE